MPTLTPAQRLLQQQTAFKMNNSATCLFLQRQDEEAFALYQQSLELLIEATPKDTAPRENERGAFFYSYSSSAILHFEQPIVIPNQEQFNGDLYRSESNCASFAALAVTYNVFLLLRRSENEHDAMNFLELAHTLSESEFVEADLHPSFRLALKYHLAEVAHEFGASDESLILFAEAIEIAESSLPHDMMFATVCTRMGRFLLGEGYHQQAQAVYAKASSIYELCSVSQNAAREQEDKGEAECMSFETTTAAAA
jgi:tetratricopeptide (TPR) repeat protein